jgi:NADH-quinone oxidoreductase subunit L
MFLACGVGAFGVAVFHLFTHAFFKALLFLGSGSVIHALGGEQDLRRMGGLRRKIPWTFWTFVLGTGAIAGIPPLAGFYSKDEILAGTLLAGRTGLFAIGLLTALLTSFYMARLLFLAFFGRFRGDHETEHHVHESPWSMLAPLVVLAVGSAVTGLVRIPEIVAPAFRLAHGEAHHAAWLPYAATLTALAGIAAAGYMYLLYTDLPGRIAAAARPMERLLQARYAFDDAYGWLVRRVVLDGSRSLLWRGADVALIDGTVNGTGAVTMAVARLVRTVQTGFVRAYVLVILGGAVAVLGYLLWRP